MLTASTPGGTSPECDGATWSSTTPGAQSYISSTLLQWWLGEGVKPAQGRKKTYMCVQTVVKVLAFGWFNHQR